jgi:hypothetical protein
MQATTATVGILLLGASLVRAQEPQRTQDFPDTLTRRNAASILFDRNLNTFNWIGSVMLDTASFETRIKLQQLYTSNIILIEGTSTTAEQRLQRNQQRVALALTRPLNDQLAILGQWSSLVYSDNKAVGLSKASVNTILGGASYTPDPLVTITPLVGHRWDNQVDVRDRGLSYSLMAQTNNLSIDGYQLYANAQFQQDRLDPRLLEQHFVHAGAQRTFLGTTRDSMDVGFSKNRREFYSASTGGLESRVDRIFSFSNLLDYEFEAQFITSLFVNVYSRTLDKDYRTTSPLAKVAAQFNTGIDEFRLDTYVQAQYRNEESGMAATTRLSYSERNERHFVTGPTEPDIPASTQLRAQQQEETKDNLARRTTLAGALALPVTGSDRVFFSGSASILRYDTPSEFNADDRDELLVVLSLSTQHNISRYLDVFFTLDGTLSHIVYLYGTLSSNNNINRILRFSPRTIYKPAERITTINSFEVLANYTVYDFESAGASARSFSYRQFAWSDSTSIELTSRMGLDFLGYLKLYDRGQLNWGEFTERRENSFIDKTYAIQARYSPERDILIAVGLRYFSQSRYSYVINERKLDSFLRSFGPTCIIEWRLNEYSKLGIRGWYEQRKLDGGTEKSLANMTMNININL